MTLEECREALEELEKQERYTMSDLWKMEQLRKQILEMENKHEEK